MTWLITTAISNAIVATALGVIAYFATRVVKNAALGHALWVLVLIKLVTPPIVDLPLPILPSWAADQVAALSQADTTAQAEISTGVAAAHAREAVSRANTMRSNGATPAHTAAVDSTGNSTGNSTAASVDQQSTGVRSIVSWLLTIWLVGIVAYGTFQLYVTWQMCKLMKLAVPDCRIDRAMHRIAKRANVKNYPIARVVPWVGSPMLWGLGGTSVIVLPEQLFDKLDDEAADTLMQHELAHFQRGDQWVRILEVLTSTLFWWHPIVWLAIREIEVYEEQCCDAWVVGQNHAKRRRYAEALLDTVDFISDAPESSRPIAVSGLGRIPLLQQRLKAIMRGEQQCMSPRSRFAVIALLAIIPLQPKLLRATLTDRRELMAPTVVVDAPTIDTSDDEFVSGVQQRPSRSLEERIAEREPIPRIDYAEANSVYGTYQLVATSGYRTTLREVVNDRTVDLSEYKICCAAFAPLDDESPKFAAGCDGGVVRLFDCTSGAPTAVLARLPGTIHSLDYAPSGQPLAVACSDGLVHLVDERATRTIGESNGAVRCVRFSQDGQSIAVVSDTTWEGSIGRVDIWDIATGQRKQIIKCPTAVGVAGFSADGLVITAEWNGAIRSWSTEGTLLSVVHRAKDTISAAAFSPDAITLETLRDTDTIASDK